MEFWIVFNLLGLRWPFSIKCIPLLDDIVELAIFTSNGSKLTAIKTLRWLYTEQHPFEILSLRDAKDMIEEKLGTHNTWLESLQNDRKKENNDV